MYNNEMLDELERLRFEDYLWIFYGSIILVNIFGNYYEKEYLITNERKTGVKFNFIFEVVLVLTFFIYIYLFERNYNNYTRASVEERDVYLVRVFGSIFLIVGVLCFIYYQDYHRKKYMY